jgi:hypothetical protein
MGGKGSTRWKDHRRAPLVEDCHQLNATTFDPAVNHDQKTGILRWTNSQTGEVTAEFSFSMGPISKTETRRLLIEPTSGGRKQAFQLGRVRQGWYRTWLFHCPANCGRRVRKLYALPKWMTFTCRQCAGLTYRSTQTHDSRLDLARRDLQGFLASRARAPQTLRSQLVTASIASDAQDPYRPGRGWGRRSTTSLSRMAARRRQEYIDKWGFPPEDSGRIARGG